MSVSPVRVRVPRVPVPVSRFGVLGVLVSPVRVQVSSPQVPVSSQRVPVSSQRLAC